MKFASYELVPSDVQEKLIKEFEAKQEKEDWQNSWVDSLNKKAASVKGNGFFYLMTIKFLGSDCRDSIKISLFLHSSRRRLSDNAKFIR